MVAREQLEAEARRLAAVLVDEEPTEELPAGTTAGLAKALGGLTGLLKSMLRGGGMPHVPAEEEELVEVVDATNALRHLEKALVKSFGVLENNILQGPEGLGAQLDRIKEHLVLLLKSQLELHRRVEAEMQRLYGARSPWWDKPSGSALGH